jgi:hypothetical protein
MKIDRDYVNKTTQKTLGDEDDEKDKKKKELNNEV